MNDGLASASAGERARFNNLFVAEPNSGCWLWTGRLDRYGYGRFSRGLRDRGGATISVPAHRFTWRMHFGSIDPGLCVCHRCDTRSCVNPAHLFLGTYRDNTQDMLSKGRNDPPAGERNGQAILTADDVTRIRASLAAGRFQRELALQYGVARQTISKIATRKKWRCVPDAT